MPRRLKTVSIAAVLVVLAILSVVALHVDDWSRDLTTNRAATSIDASDLSLRSLELTASPDEAREVISRFVDRSESWTTVNHSSDQDEVLVVQLVRTTRVFRFADDVTVYLQPSETGTRVDFASQSRVGKGDLGQNPRNIRELIQTLRGELHEVSTTESR